MEFGVVGRSIRREERSQDGGGEEEGLRCECDHPCVLMYF